MSNQQPQQPGWGGPQQPYGPNPYGQPPFPPQPPKKTSTGKIVGLGCLGVVALFVVIGIAAAVTGGSSSNDTSSSATTPTATATAKSDNKAAAGAKDNSSKKTASKKPADNNKVVFKVWGTAPAGALGSLDISYGSDSDTRQGKFKDGKFEATLPLNKSAMYYQLNAQLQGSGDINCSVTIGGKTKKGHASGGYNICDAQLSEDFTGGWQ